MFELLLRFKGDLPCLSANRLEIINIGVAAKKLCRSENV